MKIAVTGGSGFIGRQTIMWGLDSGHDMWTFDRQDGNDIRGDLSDLKGADAVIHLAGVLGTHELFDTIDEAIQVNIAGSTRVMQWCLENDAGYVGILMPDVFPSIYTATKIATKRIADALVHSEGLRAVHVRAFNAYGPGQAVGPGHPQKIVPTFARAAWAGEPLPVFGDGDQSVDLIHSFDVGRMLVDAAVLVDRKIFYPAINNLVLDAGTGVAVKVSTVAQRVIDITGSSSQIEYLPMRKGENPTHVVAQGEGWQWLDWRPRYDMDLLQRTVMWYKP